MERDGRRRRTTEMNQYKWMWYGAEGREGRKMGVGTLNTRWA